MNKILLAIVAVIAMGTAGFFLLRAQQDTVPTPDTTAPSLSPTTITPSEIGVSGSTYRDPNGMYTFFYPSDYTLDTQDPLHIRIYKRGETQRPQSEMSDGALMVFEHIDLQDRSLQSWVDTHIQQSTADGTSEIVEAKKPITQNGYIGFQYAIRGLGTSQNIVLQKDKNSREAVMITYAVSDPQQRGYQNEVDAILSSVTVLK